MRVKQRSTDDPNAAFMSDSAPQLDIRYVANLARLELSDEEIANFEHKLQDILGYMKKLDEIDVSDIEPMAHANPVLNVMREDAARPSLTQEQSLANAPKATSDQFVVAKVVE
jgi:aspartyl-tRNA(Asn)/glutamyl-tRNA(Gln) amidotransferase subunit C